MEDSRSSTDNAMHARHIKYVFKYILQEFFGNSFWPGLVVLCVHEMWLLLSVHVGSGGKYCMRQSVTYKKRKENRSLFAQSCVKSFWVHWKELLVNKQPLVVFSSPC